MCDTEARMRYNCSSYYSTDMPRKKRNKSSCSAWGVEEYTCRMKKMMSCYCIPKQSSESWTYCAKTYWDMSQ